MNADRDRIVTFGIPFLFSEYFLEEPASHYSSSNSSEELTEKCASRRLRGAVVVHFLTLDIVHSMLPTGDMCCSNRDPS